jgi:hypothetical protein
MRYGGMREWEQRNAICVPGVLVSGGMREWEQRNAVCVCERAFFFLVLSYSHEAYLDYGDVHF